MSFIEYFPTRSEHLFIAPGHTHICCGCADSPEPTPGGGGGGGGVLWYFSTYTQARAIFFLGSKILISIFWGVFRKNTILVVWWNWIFIVWSSFWGHFCCFIRVKVQAEYEDFICIFFSFLSGGGGGRVNLFPFFFSFFCNAWCSRYFWGSTVDARPMPTYEEKMRVLPLPHPWEPMLSTLITKLQTNRHLS